jgi:hypothetical protein
MATLTAKKGSLPGNSNGWERRHNAAVIAPVPTYEAGLVGMLKGWATYASDYTARYETPIGEDYVLGVAWQKIGEELRTLLNGELGRLDGGTLDSFILGTLRENGGNMEGLD